jgi:PAS domain S-box-containing protein
MIDSATDSLPLALALAAAGIAVAATVLWVVYRRGMLRPHLESRRVRAAVAELVPSAWDHAVDGLREVVVVLDRESRIVALNSSARALLGSQAEGQALAELSPELATAATRPAAEITLRSGEEARIYAVSVAPLEPRWPGADPGRLLVARDATELHRADQERGLMRAHAELLFEASPEAIALLDPDGSILRINTEFTRVFGYTAQESTGTLIDDLLADDERREEARQITLRVRRGARVRVETVRVRKDGTPLQVYLIGTPVIDGGVAGIYAIFRDQTAQKRAEERLRQSEERYRALFDQAPVGVFHYDTRLRITHANRQFVSMSRMPLEELLGFDIAGLPDARVLPSFRPALEGEVAEYDGPYRTPTGQEMWVSIRIAPLRDVQGLVIGGVGIVEDITARRQAERDRSELLRRETAARTAARHAEERALLLAEAAELFADSLAAEDALQRMARFLVQRLGERCEVFRMEESGGCVRFGAEWRRQTVHDLPPAPGPLPADIEEAIARSGRARSSLCLEDRELVVLLQAGERVFGAIRLTATEPRALGTAEIRVIEEIARRAALALENARLYREVQQAVVGRDRLLQVVSHDLRNPLATILLGASSVVETLSPERLGDEAREHLEAVVLASEQMTRLIGDLLDAARVSEGRLPLIPAPCGVEGLVADAAALVRARAADKGVVMEWRVASLPAVRADRDRVLQVLGNLLENAVRFSPEGGTVRMWADRGFGGAVVFSVEDSGPGIPEADLPQLFERFWQGEPGSHGGAGLGLSIARGIVEAHGGRIWVDSRPEGGSTFQFSLPVESGNGVPPLAAGQFPGVVTDG